MAPKTHVPSDHSRASSGDTGVPGGPPGSNPTSPNDGATSSIPGKDQLSHLGPTAATQSTRLEPKRVQPCSVPAVCLLSTCQFEASSESSISHRMCHMQVIDNTNGESNGSYVKKGIGSVKSNLAFQAFRLMDELSRAATYAAKRLSPSSPTPDAESLTSGADDGCSAPQTPETEAVYVFSPYHNATACYLYRPKGQSMDSYEVEHVAVKVVHDPENVGQAAYLLAISEKDDTLKRVGCGFASAASGEEHCRMAGAVAEGASSSILRGDIAPPQETHHHSSPQLLVNELRGQLQQRDRLRTKHCVVDEIASLAVAGKGIYLLSEDDVADAVEATLLGDLPRKRDVPFSWHDVDASEKPPRPPSLPKLDEVAQRINPQNSAPAEPATTFSLPRTCFSSTSHANERRDTRDAEFDVSTIVSQQSVAEIVWTEDDPHFRDEDRYKSRCGTTSLSSSPLKDAKGGSQVNSSLSTQGEPGDTVADKFGNLTWSRSLRRRVSENTDYPLNITSFPVLRPRHCTNEWLRPPVELEQLKRTPSTNLYQFGVDAHCGKQVAMSTERMNETVPMAWRCTTSLLHEDSLYGPALPWVARRATEMMSSGTSSYKRIGSSIGSASHRRRSSHATTFRVADSASSKNSMPGIFDRIKRGGEKMFHIHDCPDDAGAARRSNSPVSPRLSKTAPRSRDSLIRERTPEPPKRTSQEYTRQ